MIKNSDVNILNIDLGISSEINSKISKSNRLSRLSSRMFDKSSYERSFDEDIENRSVRSYTSEPLGAENSGSEFVLS